MLTRENYWLQSQILIEAFSRMSARLARRFWIGALLIATLIGQASQAYAQVDSTSGIPASAAIRVARLARFSESLEVITALEFSPDGTKLAATGALERSIHIWDLRARRIIRSIEKPGAGSPSFMDQLRYSPDGKYLAAFHGPSRRTITVWETAGGQTVTEMETNGGVCSGLAFTPDGDRLIAIFERHLINRPMVNGKAADDYVLAIYDTVEWNQISNMKTDERFHARRLALSPDGRFVAIGGTYIEPRPARVHQVRILIIDIERLAIVRTIIARTAQTDIGALAWSADGQRIAFGGMTGGSFKEADALRIWDVGTGEVVAAEKPENNARVNSIRYTPDGRFLIVAGVDSKTKVWDAEHRNLMYEVPANPWSLAVSRDGRRFARGGIAQIDVFELK